jgi:uncharacterized protein YoxC
MANKSATNGIDSDKILDQQFRRAIDSFEGIMLSQIDLTNRLSNRLNYAVRGGVLVLAVIAFSILILLLTLSAQINRISSVVANMNNHFDSVSEQMGRINTYIGSMEKRVALLDGIDKQTAVMDREMLVIAENMESIRGSMGDIGQHVVVMRNNVGNISNAIDHMNFDVLRMSADMHRMAQPARTMNKMFPFP